MSQKQIDHSPDLSRLQNEGYEIEVKDAYLIIHSVPYMNASREIARGILISPPGDERGSSILLRGSCNLFCR